MTSPWQLQHSIDAIIFDCDGTLSTIEGIDELALQSEACATVKALTAEAMGKTGINTAIYQKRLALVKPNYNQVQALGKKYSDHQVPDAAAVIQILKKLNKSIYLISAGLLPAVTIFGNELTIPSENIFAIDIQFDAAGHYLNFDRQSPLSNSNGKKEIINILKSQHTHLIYVGDGLNDLVAIDLVTRFIGFGGAFYRENIAQRCQFYITTLSMAALLPLVITVEEMKTLTPSEETIYKKGLSAIEMNQVIIQSNMANGENQ